jgi:hypothetical protein
VSEVVGTGQVTFSDLLDATQANLLNPATWVVGSSGSQPGFTQYGTVNSIENDLDPEGRYGPVWRSERTTLGDSGWRHTVTDLVTIDPNRTYRFIVYVKRNNTDGSLYFGPESNVGTRWSTNTFQSLAGVGTTNPYFIYLYDLPVADRWYVIIGYVHGIDCTCTTNLGGIYDTVTGQKVANTTDFRWLTGTTKAGQFVMLYQATTSVQKYWGPRIELCDGNDGHTESIIAGAASAYRLNEMANDGLFTQQEKVDYKPEWCSIYNDEAATSALPTGTVTASGEFKSLRDEANTAGIWTPTTGGTAAKIYYDAANDLRSYLFNSPALLLASTWSTTIPITKADWLSKRATYKLAADGLRAAISRAEADAAQANAEGQLPRFRGSLSSDPASSNREGDYYYNTTSSKVRAYVSSAWADASAAFTPAGVGADASGTAASLVPRFRGSLTSDPASDNRAGDYYYNSSTKTLRAYISSAWADASAAMTAAGIGARASDWKPTWLTDFVSPPNSASLLKDTDTTGLCITSTKMGYYNGSAWKTYMDNTGKFYLAGAGSASLSWDGTDLTIVAAGIKVGTGGYGNAAQTLWLGADGKFSLKDKVTWDGTTFTLNGDLVGATIKTTRIRNNDDTVWIEPSTSGYTAGIQVSSGSLASPSSNNTKISIKETALFGMGVCFEKYDSASSSWKGAGFICAYGSSGAPSIFFEAGGSTKDLVLNANLLPYGSGLSSLGASSSPWKNLYLYGDAIANCYSSSQTKATSATFVNVSAIAAEDAFLLTITGYNSGVGEYTGIYYVYRRYGENASYSDLAADATATSRWRISSNVVQINTDGGGGSWCRGSIIRLSYAF